MKVDRFSGRGVVLASADKRSQDDARKHDLTQKSKHHTPRRFKELDCVKIISSKKDCPFKKGMEAAVLDVFPGNPDALMLEVIDPPIIDSITSDRVRLLECAD